MIILIIAALIAIADLIVIGTVYYRSQSPYGIPQEMRRPFPPARLVTDEELDQVHGGRERADEIAAICARTEIAKPSTGLTLIIGRDRVYRVSPVAFEQEIPALLKENAISFMDEGGNFISRDAARAMGECRAVIRPKRVAAAA